MAVKAATAVLIGMGALACGLAAPRAAAQTSCAALGQIEAFVRQADQPRRPPDAREAANLSGALEQALGAGQLNGAERRAFGVYLDRLTQGIAPGPRPLVRKRWHAVICCVWQPWQRKPLPLPRG